MDSSTGVPTRKRGRWAEMAERRVCVKCDKPFWVWQERRGAPEVHKCAPCLYKDCDAYNRMVVNRAGWNIPRYEIL